MQNYNEVNSMNTMTVYDDCDNKYDLVVENGLITIYDDHGTLVYQEQQKQIDIYNFEREIL